MTDTKHNLIDDKEKNSDLKLNLDKIIDFFPDATFIIDKEEKIIAWNSAMEELTNTKAEEVLGRSSLDYSEPLYGEIKPFLINLALNPHNELLKKNSYIKKKGDTLSAELFVPRLKRGGVYLSAKAKPLYDDQGNIIGAIETIRDITDRTLTEQKLKERIKELKCLFGIIKLLEKPNISVDDILMGTLEEIKIAMQFPSLCGVQIIFNDKKYATSNFIETPWKICDSISIHGKELSICVSYTDDKSFLLEEEDLLEKILEQIKAFFVLKLGWIF